MKDLLGEFRFREEDQDAEEDEDPSLENRDEPADDAEDEKDDAEGDTDDDHAGVHFTGRISRVAPENHCADERHHAEVNECVGAEVGEVDVRRAISAMLEVLPTEMEWLGKAATLESTGAG